MRARFYSQPPSFGVIEAAPPPHHSDIDEDGTHKFDEQPTPTPRCVDETSTIERNPRFAAVDSAVEKKSTNVSAPIKLDFLEKDPISDDKKASQTVKPNEKFAQNVEESGSGAEFYVKM